ncbi:MAG: hypothetical protein BAJALOKI2v1_50091 [Promethearchaeota archaeon]|nr:MAG: hypothetical protein BAJALOKI2v1_50091 [Candidatus Lokiarchaeota archaeon]
MMPNDNFENKNKIYSNTWFTQAKFDLKAAEDKIQDKIKYIFNF